MNKTDIEKAMKVIDDAEATHEFAHEFMRAINTLDYDKISDLHSRVDKILSGNDMLSSMTVLIHLIAFGLVKAGPVFLEHYRSNKTNEPDLPQAIGLVIGAAYHDKIQDQLDRSARGKT